MVLVPGEIVYLHNTTSTIVALGTSNSDFFGQVDHGHTNTRVAQKTKSKHTECHGPVSGGIRPSEVTDWNGDLEMEEITPIFRGKSESTKF